MVTIESGGLLDILVHSNQTRYRQVLGADWASPAEVKREIGSASILKDGRAVFNIGGNKYRIVQWISNPSATNATTRRRSGKSSA